MCHGQPPATVRPLRSLALLLLTTGCGPALAAVAWPLLAHPTAGGGPATLADLVAAACAATALVAWAWLALGVGACWRSARQGAPRAPSWAPRLAPVLVAAALGVTLPASGATASPGSTTTDLLRGLQVPDRALGTSAPLPERTVRVRVGDCLWGLAEAQLPAGASPREVDRAWRALYRLNRSRVGPDPDLLHPGTELVLPTTLDRAPHAGGPR
jgi:hypothetical protein